MNKQTLFLGTLAVIALIFIGGKMFYQQGQSEQQRAGASEKMARLIRADIPSKGDPQAKVKIVEFLDPACGTCAKFHPLIADLLKKHPGKLQVFVRYAPFHKGSDYMVKMLEAARKQGKFWQTLEVMFATQADWASHNNPQPQKIWKFLGPLNLDLNKLGEDINDPRLDAILLQAQEDAAVLNVTKTPEFFVNGRPLPQFGYEPLLKLVEEELSSNY